MPTGLPLPARRRAVQRILWAVLFLNLAVAVAKLVTGWWSGTISMVADGFHSLTDSASNVVGLVAVAVAHRPPDESHPYGHHKFETLAALAIGGLLMLAAWEILQSCLERLLEGGTPQVGSATFTVMLVTLAVNIVVSTYERRRADQLASELLRADAAHTRSDVYTSLAVIASLVAARLGMPQLDLAAALVITAVIAVAAYQILRASAAGLADSAALSAEEVRSVALEVPGVESVHKIRTRGPAEAAHADLHVQVRPDLRLDQAHVIGHMVTDRLRRELGIGDVLAHVEPPPGHRTTWRPGEGRAPASSPPRQNGATDD